MKTQDYSWILSRHAPDMERGFTIQTNYGDLRIEAGRLADRIRDLVTQHCRLEMLRAEEAERQDGAAAGGAPA